MPTERVGRTIWYLPTTGSTQQDALGAAEQGASDGLVIVTDRQTAGRGRGDNRWWAPAGCCILFSWLVRSPLPWERASWLTMAASLAVADGIQGAVGLDVGIKWPNDVIIQGKKLGGILTETVADSGGLLLAVVGIGVNVNLSEAEMPREIIGQATSLSSVLGHEVPRDAVLWEILLALDREYARMLEGHSPLLRWKARLKTLGRHVEIMVSDKRVKGLAEDVEKDGGLIIRLDDGGVMRVWTGVVQRA